MSGGCHGNQALGQAAADTQTVRIHVLRTVHRHARLLRFVEVHKYRLALNGTDEWAVAYTINHYRSNLHTELVSPESL